MNIYIVGELGERHEDITFEGAFTKTGLINSSLIPVQRTWDSIFEALDNKNNDEFLEFDFVCKKEFTIQPGEEQIIMSDKGYKWCEETFIDDVATRMRKIAKVKVM